MKIDFTEKTVSLNAVLTFDQAAMQQELLQMAVLEAVEAGHAIKAMELGSLADLMGFDMELEVLPATPDNEDGLDDSGNLPHGLPGGQDSEQTE